MVRLQLGRIVGKTADRFLGFVSREQVLVRMREVPGRILGKAAVGQGSW